MGGTVIRQAGAVVLAEKITCVRSGWCGAETVGVGFLSDGATSVGLLASMSWPG